MQSLSRALTLLAELARFGKPATLSELTGAVNLHKSTVHRMLATFVEHNLVYRDGDNRYIVGTGAFDLARAAREESLPDTAIGHALTKLCDQVGATASYALPRAGRLVRVLTSFTSGTAEVHSRSLPWHASASGKAYLALRPRAEIDRIIGRSALPALTSRTLTDPLQVRQLLIRVRTRGYAVDDRECHPGQRALAAPVLDLWGRAVAAVDVQLPDGLVSPADVRNMAAELISCADQMSAAAGRKGDAPLPVASAELDKIGA